LLLDQLNANILRSPRAGTSLVLYCVSDGLETLTSILAPNMIDSEYEHRHRRDTFIDDVQKQSWSWTAPSRLTSRGAEPESPSDTRTNHDDRNTTRMAQAHRWLGSSDFSHRLAMSCRGCGIDSIARGWRVFESDGVLCSYCPPTCTQTLSDDNASSDNHAIHHLHVRISRTADPDQAHGWQLCKPTLFPACEEN
jgi:hypothetical protein